MSLLLQQSAIEQEGTDVIENLPSDKKCICSLCGFIFSEDKYLASHVNLCKNIENPNDRLVVDPASVKKEEMDSPELVDEQAISELTLDIKDEEMELTKTTVTVYGQSIDAPKAEPLEEVFLCSKYDDAAAQSTHLKERGEVFKRVRTNAGEKPYKCTICDYSAVKSSNLTRHMSTHSGEKQFKCTLCDYASAHKIHLTLHTRTHTGEKPFKCTICDYAAVRSNNLTKHMSRHTGEKRFKCTLCDYASVDKSRLTLHTRTHTGEKPFKCIVCDYASAHNTHLTLHMRKHTGEKRFKCTVCDYASVCSSNLTRHMSTHTREKLVKLVWPTF